MKKRTKIFLSIITVFFSLIFTACPTYVTLNTPQLINGTGTISGTIRISEDSSYANKTAFPVLATKYYYKITAKYTENMVSKSRSFELGELPDSNGNMNFTLNLPLGLYTKFTAEAYTTSSYDSDGTVSPVLSGIVGGKVVSEESPFVSGLDFVLRPGNSATGSIELSFIVNGDSGINSIKIKDQSATPFADVEADITIIGGTGTYDLSLSDVQSGIHNITVSFYKNGTELLYQCNELINVYDGMTTNTWVQNGSSEHLTDDGSGNTIFKVTLDMVKRFAQTNIFVDSTYSGTTENGTYFSPYKTVASALNKALTATYPSTSSVFTINIKCANEYDGTTGTVFVENFTSNLEIPENHSIIMSSYNAAPGDGKSKTRLNFNLNESSQQTDLTVRGNLTLNGVGVSTSVSNPTHDLVYIQDKGHLIMNDKSFVANAGRACGITITSNLGQNAKLTMNAGSLIESCGVDLINGNAITDACAIYAGTNAVVTLNGGKIQYCSQGFSVGPNTSKGTIILVDSTSASLTMNEGFELSNCGSSTVTAGAVYVGTGCIFTMNGGTIKTCTGKDSGGVYNTCTTNINGGEIKSNTGSTVGGIYNKTGTTNINAGKITSNTGGSNAGGIQNEGTLTITGGKISDNKKSDNTTIIDLYNRVNSMNVDGTAGNPISMGVVILDYSNGGVQKACSINITGNLTKLNEDGTIYPIAILNTSTTNKQFLTNNFSSNYNKFRVNDPDYYVKSDGYVAAFAIGDDRSIDADPFPSSAPTAGKYKVDDSGLKVLSANWSGQHDFKDVTFVLVDDIDVNSETSWTPIGTASKPFAGTFDGNGKKITNIHISEGSTANRAFGLFGEIKNATIKNVTVTGSTAGLTKEKIGVIAGEVSGTCVIENCISEVNLSGSGNDYGGIVGVFSGGNLTIRNCINKNNISNGYKAGGILGHSTADNTSTVLIENCANFGTITSRNGWGSGGIYGFANTENVTIRNCFNSGTVKMVDENGDMDTSTMGSRSGAIVGDVEGSNPFIEYCYWSNTNIYDTYKQGLVGSRIWQYHNTEVTEGSGVYRIKVNNISSGDKATKEETVMFDKNALTFSSASTYTYTKTSLVDALNAWITAQSIPANYKKWKVTSGVISFDE